MSGVNSLATLALVGILRTSSATLTAVDGVTASANGWDTRTSGFGCAPNGCVASNAADGSLYPASRWSCNPVVSNVNACELTLELDAPQDIEAINIALWKGNERTRTIDIWVDGEMASTIESSGTTEDYEMYALVVIGATTVVLQAVGMADNGWLSILEVQILVDDYSIAKGSPAPSPYPTMSTTVGSTMPTLDDSGCLRGSIPPSLEIVIFYTDELLMHVLEPDGKRVGLYNKIGGVGTMMDAFLRAGFAGPEYKHRVSYVLSNGLSVDTDAVLGDYTVAIQSFSNTSLIISAYSNGDLLWEDAGSYSEGDGDVMYGVTVTGTYNDVEDDLVYTATVTEYVESDCIRDTFGECPGGTIGVDGRQPCTECPGERVSRVGTTFCTVGALRNAGLTEAVADAIEADAIGGFLSPAYIEFDERSSAYDPFYLYEEDNNILHLSGTIRTSTGTPLPDSVVLLLYIESEDAPDDIVRGQGSINTSTTAFSVTLTDVPERYSKVILSFAVLDLEDAVDNMSGDGVLVLDVVNEGCNEAPLRISLDWDDEDENIAENPNFSASRYTTMYLFVNEPSGNRISRFWPVSDIGYLNLDRQEYVVFSGLSGDEMLGDFEFLARYRNFDDNMSVNWNLTLEVNGALVWAERGTLSEADQMSFSSDDDRRRRLLTSPSITESYFFDDSYGNHQSTLTSYFNSPVVQTEWFTFSLGSYNSSAC